MGFKLPGPTFPALQIPTPFGKIDLPKSEPLVLGKPSLNSKRVAALSHAIGADFALIFGVVPYIGSAVGGHLADLHYYEMVKHLTKEESAKFEDADKRIPSNGLALLQSFMMGDKK